VVRPPVSPWTTDSAVQQPQEETAASTEALEPPLLAGVDSPADPTRASQEPATSDSAPDQAVTGKAEPPSTAGPVTPPAVPQLTKRPVSGKAEATTRRTGSSHDPLSGPWPSFTKRAEPAAGDEEPEETPAAAPAAPAAESETPPAAPPEKPAAAAAAGQADVAAAATKAAAGIGAVWPAETAIPLGAAEHDDSADDPVLPLAGAGAAATMAAFGPGTGSGAGSGGPAWPAGAAAPGSGPDLPSGSGPARPVGPAGPGGPIGPGRRRRLGPVVGVAAAVTALVVGGGTYFLLQKPSTARAAGDHPANTQSPVAKGPEHVVSITPADGTQAVNGAADIRVEFSAPLSAASPMPTLTPAIAGSWQSDGNSAVFVPARGFKPRTKVTVKVPAGSTGVTSTGGGRLAAPVTAKFRVGAYSTARLEQLLAQLGYLPLTWAPLSGSSPALTDAHAQLSAAYEPPAGTYTWQSGYPAALTRLWRPDKASKVLQGAVMAFQADHGLMSDMVYENQVGLTLKGSIGRRLWKAMFRAAARDAMNKHGYTYALASQHSPEKLTVWHNGVQIFRHLANTGIPVAPTAVRTDPVYIRLQSQIMKGTNPDGTKYADPVAWVAYFHAGEAVHYFPRYSYGYQQSLGCVELPWSPAKKIWPYLTFGTLVTVTAP
jgi:hypothetical protein